MTAKFYHEGNSVDYTPGADVTAGDVVDLGSGYTGVAANDITSGVKGALQVRGVFRVTKASGGGVTFSAGDTVGYDATGETAVAAGTGDFDIGKAVAAAADADAEVHVQLNA